MHPFMFPLKSCGGRRFDHCASCRSQLSNGLADLPWTIGMSTANMSPRGIYHSCRDLIGASINITFVDGIGQFHRWWTTANTDNGGNTRSKRLAEQAYRIKSNSKVYTYVTRNILIRCHMDMRVDNSRHREFPGRVDSLHIWTQLYLISVTNLYDLSILNKNGSIPQGIRACSIDDG